MNSVNTRTDPQAVSRMSICGMLGAFGLISPARRLARAMGRGRPSSATLLKWYDLNQIQGYESLLNLHGYSLRTFSSVLDFGCGRGRHIQYLRSIATEASLFGCDVNRDAIVEARRGCSRAQFSMIDHQPPLAYEDGQFDLIFSFSVFTQLSERTHELWLKELDRKLGPRGVMIHTTHGHEYLRRVAMFSPEQLLKYGIRQPIDKFIKSNPDYYYLPYGPSTPNYGLAIISKEYAVEKWPRLTGLSLVDYAEAAMEAHPEGCHDMVMLVKG